MAGSVMLGRSTDFTMTNPRHLALFLFLFGLLLYDFLFWQEIWGVNALIFSVFYLSSLLLLYPRSRSSRGFRITAGGTLLSAALIVWHNSGAAKFAWLVSVPCAAGFAQEPALRHLLNALLQYLRGWWQAPSHLGLALRPQPAQSRRVSLGRMLNFSLVPLLVAAVFYGLYYVANEKFAALSDDFWRRIGRIFSFDLPFERLFFLLIGCLVLGAAFWRNRSNLRQKEQAVSDDLRRTKPPRLGRLLEPPSMLALKQEYRQSLLLLGLLNGLLLLVNATDVRYVWFGFDTDAQQDLKSYLHEGTYLLIVSMLLAMWVLFHVFRKNLHFYPDKGLLRQAAALWLIQNAVLAVSVGVRTWRYIDFHGLAYKRIGVALFLALVFFGLATLWVKIGRRRTMSWLWRQNGWALYGLLLFNAGIDWDVWITRYNLSGQPKGVVDVAYLLHTVSDKNLYLLEARASELPDIARYPEISPEEIGEAIQRKRKLFEHRQNGQSWLSWNFADARNTQR